MNRHPPHPVSQGNAPRKTIGAVISRTFWIWARLLGGAAILAALVWRQGAGPFVDGLRLTSPAALLTALVVTAGTTLCCAWRWSLVGRRLGFADLAGTLDTAFGKPEEALKYLSQALDEFRALYREKPNRQLKLQEAVTLYQIGLIHTSASTERKTGIEFLSQAIEIYRTFPEEKLQVANLLSLIGSQYSLDFNYVAALKNWDDALEIYSEMGDKFGQVVMLHSKRGYVFSVGQQGPSRESFNQALLILQSADFVENQKKNHLSFTAGFEIYKELGDAFVEYVRQDRIGIRL